MSTYRIPRLKTNIDGEERRVGYELEFAGLEMPEVAKILADTLQGNILPATHAECTVEVPDVGDFVVELDWRFAKEAAKDRARDQLAGSGQSSDDHSDFDRDSNEVPDDPMMEWLTRVASQVVPVEIVCPPIPISQLEVLDEPVAKLRAAGALGTEESLLYAFGVHVNPELPDLSPETLIKYLKAFCVCQAWLVKAHKVDPVRRLTPYIDLYPGEYISRVMDYKSESMSDLIDDYLTFNPTRNRALDLTPLFKFIDAERIDASLQDPRINSRPTFHYRMPNCEIEKADWSLAHSWHYWSVIEHLVSEPETLEDLCRQCAQRQDKLISIEEAAWHPKLDEISRSLE